MYFFPTGIALTKNMSPHSTITVSTFICLLGIALHLGMYSLYILFIHTPLLQNGKHVQSNSTRSLIVKIQLRNVDQINVKL